MTEALLVCLLVLVISSFCGLLFGLLGYLALKSIKEIILQIHLEAIKKDTRETEAKLESLKSKTENEISEEWEPTEEELIEVAERMGMDEGWYRRRINSLTRGYPR